MAINKHIIVGIAKAAMEIHPNAVYLSQDSDGGWWVEDEKPEPSTDDKFGYWLVRKNVVQYPVIDTNSPTDYRNELYVIKDLIDEYENNKQ